MRETTNLLKCADISTDATALAIALHCSSVLYYRTYIMFFTFTFTLKLWYSFIAISMIISRPGQSQGPLYKHCCGSSIN